MLTYADIRSRKRARAAKTLLMLVWTLVDKVLSLLAFTGTELQIKVLSSLAFTGTKVQIRYSFYMSLLVQKYK